MDNLEAKLKSLNIPDHDFALQECRQATLNLLEFCRRQQKANSELTIKMLEMTRDSIQRTMDNADKSTRTLIDKLAAFNLDYETASNISKLARLIPWPISYDSKSKAITIDIITHEVTDGEEVSCYNYFTVRAEEDCFVLDVSLEFENEAEIRQERGLPSRYPNLGQLADALLHLGLYDQVKSYILQFSVKIDFPVCTDPIPK